MLTCLSQTLFFEREKGVLALLTSRWEYKHTSSLHHSIVKLSILEMVLINFQCIIKQYVHSYGKSSETTFKQEVGLCLHQRVYLKHVLSIIFPPLYHTQSDNKNYKNMTQVVKQLEFPFIAL